MKRKGCLGYPESTTSSWPYIRNISKVPRQVVPEAIVSVNTDRLTYVPLQRKESESEQDGDGQTSCCCWCSQKVSER